MGQLTHRHTLAVIAVIATLLSAAPLAQTANAQAVDTTSTAPGVAQTVTPPDTAVSAIDVLTDDVQAVGRDLVSGDIEGIWKRGSAFFGQLVEDYLPRTVGAIVLFLLLIVIYRIIEKLLSRTLHRAASVDAGLEHLLGRTYRIIALTFIVVLVLAQFGVNVAALLAGLSIAGIAVGFAAQDTVQNYIAGITILLDKPFRVGDNIRVDGIFGRVVQITLRSTRVQTQNNEIMVMPNVLMINQKLVNHTALGVLRIEVPFGIAYKEYPDEARRVVLATTKGDERLDTARPPEVVVTGLNNSSVDLSLRLFLADPRQELAVRYDYIERVREALRAADIEIPFPHLQLFIDEARAFEKTFLMQRQLPE